MSEHFNKLTPAELERLALLSEELGEAQQAIGKILRHGYESYNPDKLINQGARGGVLTNRMELEKELGDVEAAIQIMVNGSDVNNFKIADAIQRKMEKVAKYLHHNTLTRKP